MSALHLGIDIGTSGVRSAVVDGSGAVVGTARAPLPQTGPVQDAGPWWDAVSRCLRAQVAALAADGHAAAAIADAAICGTSGSMVLVGPDLAAATPALMYASRGFEAEAARIAAIAPPGHITRGSASALARMLRLQSLDDGRATALCHQADLILARLRGAAGISDANNSLKLGFDPATGTWPDWFAEAGIATRLLPRPLPVGTALGPVSAAIAAELGLPPTMILRAGTTDSIAAFLAAGADAFADAVTSLGTTLAVKLLSDTRIDEVSSGIYSHRLGSRWLVGGASNTGGGVLADHFAPDRIDTLTRRIDPDRDSGLDYYPLSRPGERFPVADPGLPPRLTPRPDDDAHFLHGMLEGIARIERAGYTALQALGAPYPTRILTAGGGAASPVWTRIRARILGVEVRAADDAEASVGMARLCRARSAGDGPVGPA